MQNLKQLLTKKRIAKELKKNEIIKSDDELSKNNKNFKK